MWYLWSWGQSRGEHCITNLCICTCLLPVEWWLSSILGFSAAEGCFRSDSDNAGAWPSSWLFTWMRITIFTSCREDTQMCLGYTQAPDLIIFLQTSLAFDTQGPEIFCQGTTDSECSRTNPQLCPASLEYERSLCFHAAKRKWFGSYGIQARLISGSLISKRKRSTTNSSTRKHIAIIIVIAFVANYT